MPSEEAEKAKDAGNEALKAKDYAGAVKHYTEAIKADPNSHTYYSNRSAAFASMNKPQDALADADKCINMEPTFARGYGRKGVALYKLGRYADAMVAYSSGLNKDAGNASLTQGLEAAKKAKELMETNLAGMGRSQPQYQQQGGPPATAEWRSAMPAGLGRVALNIAMLAFSVMYIAGAVQPANDAARYSYFSRAVMCALGAYVVDIATKFEPCPANPMDVYKQGIQSPAGQSFALWTQKMMMTGPTATSLHGMMFAGAFLNSTPCPPALGCLLLVSLHDLLVDVNGLLESRIPSLAGKLSGVFGSAKTGLRTHCPYFCAWFEVATVVFLLIQLATPKRAFLQLFLMYQSVTMKYNAAQRNATKDAWLVIDGVVASKLPGPVLGIYRKATGVLGGVGRQ